MQTFRSKHQSGFTLFEVLVVLTIFSLVMPYIAPEMLLKVSERRADVVIGDTATIYAAAAKYYSDNDAWPGGLVCTTAISELVASGYMDNVDSTNTFGGTITTTCTPTEFTIIQDTEEVIGNYIAAALPATRITGIANGEITSTYPVPGSEPALQIYLDLEGTRSMTGNLQMGNNSIDNAVNVIAQSLTINTLDAATVNSNLITTTNLAASNQMEASVYRDSDDLSYSIDPSSTSNVNRLEATGDIRAPIYYDSDNLNYYVDPAGQSVLDSAQLGVAELSNNYVSGGSCTTEQVGTTSTGELMSCVNGTWEPVSSVPLTMISVRGVGSGSGTRGWTTYNASRYVPENASFAMLQGEGYLWGPDCRSSSCKPYLSVRQQSGQPSYILMRGYCAGPEDYCGASGTIFVPLSSSKTFQWRVVGSRGFHLGYTLRLIGYM